MSRKKADSQSSVKYLGFQLKDRELPTDRSGEAVTRIAVAFRRHRGGPGSDQALPHLDPQFSTHSKTFPVMLLKEETGFL